MKRMFLLLNRMSKWFAAMIVIIMIMVLAQGCKRGTEAPTSSAGTTKKTTVRTTVKTTPVKTGTVEKTTQTQQTGTENNPAVTEPANGNGETLDNDPGDGSSTTDDEIFGGLTFNINDLDLGGNTLVFTTWTDPFGNDPYFADKISESEKMFNYKFEFKRLEPADAYHTIMLNDFLAGIKFGDICLYNNANGQTGLTPMKQGFFLPLDGYIDYSHPKWAPWESVSKWVNGKHYSMSNPVYSSDGVAYNPGMLAEEGLPDILEMAKAKKWNWEAFLNVAVNCTRDVNGDGIVDKFGVGMGGLLMGLLQSNGVIAVEAAEGGFVCNYTKPEALRTFNFLQELSYTYKVVDNPSFPYNAISRSRLNFFQKGTLAMLFCPSYVFMNIYNSGMTTVKSASFPTGPDVDPNETIYLGNGGIAFNIFKYSDFKANEVLAVFLKIRYVDPAVSYEVYKTSKMANNIYTTEDLVDFWWDLDNTASFKMSYVSCFLNLTTTFDNMIKRITVGESPGSVVESVMPAIMEGLK